MISFLLFETEGSSNEIEERTDMTSFQTKSGQNEVGFEFVSAVHQSKLSGEFVLAPKHLWATISPWRLRNRWVCVLELHLLWHAIFFPVPFSFNKGHAEQQHLQDTSNINTLCRIAELPQIYLHLYDGLQRSLV